METSDDIEKARDHFAALALAQHKGPDCWTPEEAADKAEELWPVLWAEHDVVWSDRLQMWGWRWKGEVQGDVDWLRDAHEGIAEHVTELIERTLGL